MKDKQLKGAMWECCRATTTQEFDAAMLRLQRINTGTWEYLNKLDQKEFFGFGVPIWTCRFLIGV